MNNSCFIRPNKPMTCAVLDFSNIKKPDEFNIKIPKLIAVDKSTQCHVTPAQVAGRMVEYLDYEHATINKAAMSILEPHAGTGQLVQACMDAGILRSNILAIELNHTLVNVLNDKFAPFLCVNQGDFLEHDISDPENLEDRIICNPPFSNVVKHIDKVYKCLKSGGLAVCLVPISYNKIVHEVLEVLPVDTFASCKVSTKIIRIKK
jgi:phospholipid N-methyltransferase